jgi:uncharacterized membrane protein
VSIKELPIALTFIAGTVVLLEFFFKAQWLSSASREFLNWSVILYAFATALGAFNLLRIHSDRIRQKKDDSWYSSVLIAVLAAYFLIGVLLRSTSVPYKFVWDNLFQPLSATVFSLNAFFMMSAAFRALRVKTLDGTLLLIAAILVMLGNVPIGSSVWRGFPAVMGWIMRTPNTAAMRGIIIGAALGGITISFRIILGIERSHLGGLGE